MIDNHRHLMVVFSVLLQVRFVLHWVTRFANSVPALPLALGGSTYSCLLQVQTLSETVQWSSQQSKCDLVRIYCFILQIFSHICYFPRSYSLRTKHLGISDALTLEVADLSRRLVPTYVNTFYQSLFPITTLSELLVQTREHFYLGSLVSISPSVVPSRTFWIKLYFLTKRHLSCCYITFHQAVILGDLRSHLK